VVALAGVLSLAGIVMQGGSALAHPNVDREAQEALSAAESAESAESTGSLAARTAREVAALIAQRRAAIEMAEAEPEDTLARYQLEVESARIAAQLRILARTGGQVVPPGSRLPMPVVGWKSSDFGMRYDPFYKVWQLHAGVDLAAPGGTPIWAAAAGQVVRAGWNGGYGNYTCIDHGTYQGKAFATCYAHQSQILVHVGQSVQQGQVIGRVGTTGASTGTHLHFEVRLNGEPVDPLPWLPACLC
jgi:murein DD-endopeptidase MepM/ murein hydrolase activator NlpD